MGYWPLSFSLKSYPVLLRCDDFLDIEFKASYQAVLRVAFDEEEALRSSSGASYLKKQHLFMDKEVSAWEP